MECSHLWVRTEDIVNKGLWRLFPAINCDKTLDIPTDYPGPIGVPITYMDKHEPQRFELVGMLPVPEIGGRRIFKRLIIRHLHPELPEFIDLAAWLKKTGESLEIIIEEELR